MLCPSIEGKMMTETAFRRAWQAYENYLRKNVGILLDKKDIDHITPHMLRHTYATLLYDAGVDVKNAQRYLGHSDVLTTLRIYTHLSKEKEKVGDKKFDDYLAERMGNDLQLNGGE